jgi:hypothetical protein
VIVVPILDVFGGTAFRKENSIAAGMAVVGVALLELGEGEGISISTGDVLYLASSFVSIEPESGDVVMFSIKFASHQWLAHVFQTPHRLYCTLFVSSNNESYTQEGLSHWVAGPLEAAHSTHCLWDWLLEN